MGKFGLYLLLGILGVAIVARVRSLLRPSAFPPWLTPILESPWRSPARIMERSGLAEGERVLEIGPGAGYLTQFALERLGPGGRLVCLDLQIEMLRKVRQRLGARTPPLVCASGSQLPFRDRAFDRCFLVSVLGEIPDKRSALTEQARILRPDGVLAVSEALPDPDFIRDPVLRRLAEGAGFESGAHAGSVIHYTRCFVNRAMRR